MRCEKCGAEMREGFICPQCGQSGDMPIRVLTSEEKDTFDGVTIDQTENNDSQYKKSHHSGSGMYSRTYRFQLGGGNFLLKLIAGVVFTSLIMFIALPVSLVLLAVGAFFWYLLRKR